MSAAGRRPDDETVEHEMTITNEFTAVKLRKVNTGNGERLEIESLRLPHAIRLDALVLESLTWRTPLDVADGLETPMGPGAEDPEGH